MAWALLIHMTPSEITNAYTSLWMRFAATCRNASFHAVAKQPVGFLAQSIPPKKFRVESLIYLKDWPYKVVSDAKHVDIVVKSREVFSCDLGCMTESKVKVTYFQTQSGTAIPLLAVHYDFDVQQQSAHPIFHAQLGVADFDQVEIDKVGFRKAIQKAETSHYGNLRIPTAYMNLASVLLGIIADHMPGKYFNGFLSELRRNVGVTWNARCTGLETSLGNGGWLHSHHWYNPIPKVILGGNAVGTPPNQPRPKPACHPW
jgi:hypothetical protein